MMKRSLLTWLVIVLASAMIYAQDFALHLQAGYFIPKEEVFRDIYGSGFYLGGEAEMDLGRGFSLWAAAGYFSRQGELSFTREETNLSITPLEMGGRFYLTAKTHTFVPYLGAGVGVSRFEESNVIGTVSEDEISFSGQVGLLLKLKHRLFLDTRVLYRYCHIKPDEVEVDIGGMVISAGVKYFF